VVNLHCVTVAADSKDHSLTRLIAITFTYEKRNLSGDYIWLSFNSCYNCDSLETLSISPGILAVLKHLTCMCLGKRLYDGASSGMTRL
jgi:hypothetical protein